MINRALYIPLLLIAACHTPPSHDIPAFQDTTGSNINITDTVPVDAATAIDTLAVDTTAGINEEIQNDIAAYAQSLIGVPYKYAGSTPETGFDCSGFITYVFKHFYLTVPRSSIDFTNVGKEVTLDVCRRGDLILFTGTDSTETQVGHMGIITTSGEGGISFIHSTSGKQYSVTITPLNSYYMSRFVKVVRVFDERGNLSL